MGPLRSPWPAAVRPLSAFVLMVRRTVFSTGLTADPVLHRSDRIPGIRIKESALIRRRRLVAPTVLGRRCPSGVLQYADIALLGFKGPMQHPVRWGGVDGASEDAEGVRAQVLDADR